MIGAKAMDPVLGVDIHIVQPPGPVRSFTSVPLT